MEKEYKAHPFEFFHGEAIRQFHLYRSANNLEANFKIDGIIFNEIIVAAKNETKKKYPEEIELSSIGGEEKTLEATEFAIWASENDWRYNVWNDKKWHNRLNSHFDTTTTEDLYKRFKGKTAKVERDKE